MPTLQVNTAGPRRAGITVSLYKPHQRQTPSTLAETETHSCHWNGQALSVGPACWLLDLAGTKQK